MTPITIYNYAGVMSLKKWFHYAIHTNPKLVIFKKLRYDNCINKQFVEL